MIGFLVIDRLKLPLDHAQQWIAIVLMAGAGASLLAQWWLIPQLALSPRQLVVWGALVAALGTFATGLAGGVYGLTLGFALASLGFGLFRPGFTSGASLAVGARRAECGGGHGHLGERRRLCRGAGARRRRSTGSALPCRSSSPAR